MNFLFPPWAKPKEQPNLLPSAAELLEYRKLIAAVINATDRLMTRTIVIDAMGRSILDGAKDETQLMTAIGKVLYDRNDPWKELEEKKP